MPTALATSGLLICAWSGSWIAKRRAPDSNIASRGNSGFCKELHVRIVTLSKKPDKSTRGPGTTGGPEGVVPHSLYFGSFTTSTILRCLEVAAIHTGPTARNVNGLLADPVQRNQTFNKVIEIAVLWQPAHVLATIARAQRVMQTLEVFQAKLPQPFPVPNVEHRFCTHVTNKRMVCPLS